MNEFRNYNVYLNGMTKANKEKVFFLEHLNLNDWETVIDFGCGGGDILAILANVTTATLIGIDRDDYMRKVTKEKVPTCYVYSSLSKGLLGPKTLVIFSSVLHEVEDFWLTLKPILKDSGATVVVRDMRFTGNDAPISKDQLSKLVNGAHHKTLSEFIAKYGMTTSKDLVHYLLKYSYIDNWELELAEDYFSFDYDDLFSFSDILYERNYTLEFKKRRVLEDFGLELTNGTHTQLILKCR